MRLLYVSRSAGVHDTRFVDAWRAGGVDVRSLQITSDSEESEVRLLGVVADFRPDVVQVGPITSPGPLVARVWDGPLIAASWAFDLLLEARDSDELADAARAVLRRADVVFVDSAAVRNEAVVLGAEPDAIVTFPWGIDAEWVARPPAARSGRHPFVFLSTRRHEHLYRVADTVAAFLAVARELPGAELWVAGSGSLTPTLRELAEQGDAGDRVRFLGERSGVELSDLYARADVYVSSTVVDGTSISLLEAMASGSLPIVSDIAGNREWVGAETGIRYPLGDVGELAALMLQSAALSAPDRKSMADAAFDLVREHANWVATTARFTDHLTLAIERHDLRARAGG